MKKKTSLFRHLFLSKNFILMLVMLVVIIITINAWFAVNKTVKATDITVKAVSTEIDIAKSVKTYYTEGEHKGEVLTDGPGEFGSDVVFNLDNVGKFVKDCTGDGKDLIVPEFNVTRDYESVSLHGGKEVNENLSGTPALSNMDAELAFRKTPNQDPPEYQYFQFEFYVRSKNPELMLQPETRLVSETESGGQSLSTVPAEKKSAYGNFNVDGLVGAIRVSLVGEACTTVNQTWSNGELTATNVPAKRTAERQLLWLPRPDVHLTPMAGNNDNWQFATGVTSLDFDGSTYKASYYQQNNSGGVTLIDNDADAVVSSGTTTVSSNHVTVPTMGVPKNITDFTYSSELEPISLVVDKNNPEVLDNYYVTKYTMKVWIEGTDAEARRAMDGGKFSISLFFA